MRVSVEGVRCRRGGRLVLYGLGFALGRGEAVVVTGRNGSGKSTLLLLLAGLLRAESGSLRVDDVGERSLPECLHLVGHRDALKASLTAAENLAFASDLLGEPWLSPAEALGRFGLGAAADLPVAYLSAGQRRRAALARLLVARRSLWLLDEPLTALDAGSQALLMGLLQAHLAEGGLLVAATHAPLPLPGARELRLDAARELAA